MISFLNDHIRIALATLVAVGSIWGANYLDNHRPMNSVLMPLTQISPSPSVVPTTIDEPSLIPSPSPTTQGKVKAAHTIQPVVNKVDDSDPIVNCEYPHVGTIAIKQSECDGTKTECEISAGKWQVVWTTECDALRASEAKKVSKPTTSTKSSGKLIDCVFDDKWGKPHEFKQVSESFCYDQKNTYNTGTIYSPPAYSPPALKSYKSNCYAGTQIIPNLTVEDCTEKQNQYTANQQDIARLEREHADACNQAVAEWNTTAENFWASGASRYGSSAQAASVLEGMRQQYAARMRTAGCTQQAQSLRVL